MTRVGFEPETVFQLPSLDPVCETGGTWPQPHVAVLPPPERKVLLMAALARWCFRHRKIVLPAWLIALVLVGGIAKSVGSSYTNNFSFPSTDSSRALDIVKANFPSQSGDSDQIVVAGEERHAAHAGGRRGRQ